MLAYPVDEAESLLQGKLETAQLNLSNCEEDLDFLREQITVSARLARYMKRIDQDIDPRGCHGKSVQLGRHAEKEGERGGGWRGKEHRSERLSRASPDTCNLHKSRLP